MALPIANVAQYELTLPSQQKKIKYRPFLVKEEKILLMALETQKPEDMLEAVKNIVKSCTFNEINPEDYPLFDLEYIFLQIRSKSVGEISKIKVLCPDDKKTYEKIEVDLSKVEVYVEDDHSNNIVLDEDRKLGVVLKYPSLKIINSGILTGDVKLEQMYELIGAVASAVGRPGCTGRPLAFGAWLTPGTPLSTSSRVRVTSPTAFRRRQRAPCCARLA